MLKNILLKILNCLSVLIIVLSIGVLLTVVLTKSGEAPNFLGYSLFRVMTGSMEPTIPTNSLIVVKRVSVSELKTGDVISFYSRDPSLRGEVNTHRILNVERIEEKLCFETKGDANNIKDKYVTQEEDVIGKVVFSSKKLGTFVRLLSNPLIFVPLIILPLVILLGHSLWESITLAKKLAREEEEHAVREAVEAIRQKRVADRAGDTDNAGNAYNTGNVLESADGMQATQTMRDAQDIAILPVDELKTIQPRELRVGQMKVRDLPVKTIGKEAISKK